METSILNNVIRPITREAGNLTFDLRDWTHFENKKHASKYNKYDDKECQHAYEDMILFISCAREMDINIIRAKFETMFGIKSGKELKELFSCENYNRVLKDMNYKYPFKCNNDTQHTAGKEREYHNTDGTTIEKATKRKSYTTNGYDRNKKNNFTIPTGKRLDARADSKRWIILYDQKGRMPMLMYPIPEKYVNALSEDMIKSGFINACRNKYAAETGISSQARINHIRMNYYRAGRYKRIAGVYGKPANTMPGIKKEK